MTRITNLLGSQTSPMVFCIQNSHFSTRIASLYWFPALICWFCAFTTATLCTRITLVSMGPRHHLWLCRIQNSDWLAPELSSLLWVPDFTWGILGNAKQRDFSTRITKSPLVTHLTCCICACKTTRLASELVFSKGPSLHLWLLCMHNSDFRTRIT